MLICIDLGSDNVIISPGVQQTISTLEWKRSPYATLQVQFSRGGIVQELPNDATGTFEIKRTGQYDSVPVVWAPAWVKKGTGESTIYTFIFSLLNPILLDPLFELPGGDYGVSGYSGASGYVSVSGYSGYSGYDDDVDVDQVTLMGEVQWITGGQTHKTLPTLIILIDNDVIREGDVGPSTPALMYGIFMPSITALTGGTPVDLDYLPTVQLITGTIIELLIDDGAGHFQWLPQVLEAGISAGPGVTTPLDYDAVTNNRRWKTATALTGSSGYSGYSGANPGASGYSGYSGKSGYSGYSGKSGYSGNGTSGFSGYSGTGGSPGGGIPYTFSTTTTAADPGAGLLRLDNSNPAAAANIHINYNDLGSIGYYLNYFNQQHVGNFIIVRSVATPFLDFWVYSITASPVDHSSTWLTIPVVNEITNNGAMSNNTPVTLEFVGSLGPLQYTQSSPGNPTGTTDTTGKMMGLAGSITTKIGTRALVIISGAIFNSGGVGDGAKVQLRAGTGSAPSNAAALTGTAYGGNI